MKITTIKSIHVCNQNEDIIFVFGYKHYRIGFEINFGIQHKINLRILFIYWHFMIRLFPLKKQF